MKLLLSSFTLNSFTVYTTETALAQTRVIINGSSPTYPSVHAGVRHHTGVLWVNINLYFLFVFIVQGWVTGAGIATAETLDTL